VSEKVEAFEWVLFAVWGLAGIGGLFFLAALFVYKVLPSVGVKSLADKAHWFFLPAVGTLVLGLLGVIIAALVQSLS